MKIRILTEMFKANECELEINEDSIVIFGNEYNRIIKLSDVENISVTRQTARAARMEISLADDMIEGVFYEKSDADMFADSLKDKMGSVLQINFG